MNHKLFLTGEKSAGKSWVIQQLAEAFPENLQGFRSWKHPKDRPDALVFFSGMPCTQTPSIIARIKNNQLAASYPEIFDTVGVPALRQVTPQSSGLVLMDEIGFLESSSLLFQQEILRILSLPVAVAGVLRQSSTPFLDMLFADKRLTILTVTPENRQEILDYCLDLLARHFQVPH